MGQEQTPQFKKASENAEVRFYGIEARKKDDTPDKMVIGGLAARFDSYTNMGWYAEVIKPGFFDEMDTTKAAALKNHDSSLVLGRTSNGTLKLSITPDGLEYEVELPDTTTGRDTYEEVKRGDIFQSSFQFTVKEAVRREVDRAELAGVFDDDTLDRLSYGGKIEIRELVKGGVLYDVSPVTFPAYEDTSVAKRSKDEAKAENPKQKDLKIYELQLLASERSLI